MRLIARSLKQRLLLGGRRLAAGLGGRRAASLSRAKQQVAGPLDHGRRHAGQPGHVHAPALVGGAGGHLMEKHQLVAVLLDEHLGIAHAG